MHILVLCPYYAVIIELFMFFYMVGREEQQVLAVPLSSFSSDRGGGVLQHQTRQAKTTD